MHRIFFIQSSVNGHLGCFRVLAIVNSAAMNIRMDVSFLIMVFSRYMPRSGIAGSYGISVLSVLRQLHFFYIYKKPKDAPQASTSVKDIAWVLSWLSRASLADER